MPDLKTAISILEMIIAAALIMLAGDYLGYRITRVKLATIIGLVVLASVIIFVIYSAIVLA